MPIAAAAAILLGASSSAALSTVSLEWNLLGSDSPFLSDSADCDQAGNLRAVNLAPGYCSANVLLTVDAAGILLLDLSFTVETTYAGGFEAKPVQLAGKGNGFGYGTRGLQFTSAPNPNLVRLFDVEANPFPAPGVTTTNSPLAVTIGTLAFQVPAMITSHVQVVLPGFFDTGNEAQSSDGSSVGLVTSGLQFVPEPTAAALLLIGFASLALVTRTSR